MPAVSSSFAETWPATAKAVEKTIKRRGITFRAFVREIGEPEKYKAIHSGIRYARPPSGGDAEKRVKRIVKWLAEHAK